MQLNPIVVDIYHGDGHFQFHNVNSIPKDSINFDQARDFGIRAVIHKATQGRMIDHAYKFRRPRALAAGLLWGAYDFNDGSPPINQAKFFWDVADPDESTRVFLDFEDNRLSNMSLGGACDYLEWIDSKLTGGRKCGIYSGNRMKEQIVHATEDQRKFLAEHDLWICQYGPHAKLIDANGHHLPWTNYFLWQYTGDGIGMLPHSVPGIQRNMDINHFDGTEDELRRRWLGEPNTGATA